MFTLWAKGLKPDPTMMCNGMLAGLVAITAPCAFVDPVGGSDHRRSCRVSLSCSSVFFWEKLVALTIRSARSPCMVSMVFGACFRSASLRPASTAPAGTVSCVMRW